MPEEVEEEVRRDVELAREGIEQVGTRLLGGVFPPPYLVATVEGGWGELDCSQNVKRSLPIISLSVKRS